MEASPTLSVNLVGRGNRAHRMREFVASPAGLVRLSASSIRKDAGRLRSKVAMALDYDPLIEFSPDVTCLVHAQVYPHYTSLLDSLGCGLISCYRGYDVQVRPGQDPGWQDTLQRLALRSTRLHFVSRGLLESHATLLPLEELTNRRRVIYQGVDTGFFSPIAQEVQSGSGFRLVSVGRLIWEKGHIYALRALKVLVDQGRQAHLSIIGEGAEREHITYWIKRLDLVDHVSLLGLMNEQQIRDQLRMCDAYLQPSLSEGLPGSVVEAAAMGLPIVATSIGGFPEIIENGRSGLLVSPGEYLELAAAIARLMDDATLRGTFGQASRERIMSDFSAVHSTRLWHDLISEVIACRDP